MDKCYMVGYPNFLWLGDVHGGLQVSMYRIVPGQHMEGAVTQHNGCDEYVSLSTSEEINPPLLPDEDNGREYFSQIGTSLVTFS